MLNYLVIHPRRRHMTIIDFQRCLGFAVQLAKKAADIHMRWRPNAAATIVWKPDRTPVTNADLEVKDLVRKKIGSAFPSHGIYSEEADEKPGNPRWIGDEIDGTYPFSRGYSDDFAFNIALEENGVLLLGVTIAPAKGLIYLGTRNWGATCNGKVITGSSVTNPSGAVFYIGSGKKNRMSHLPYLEKAYQMHMLPIHTGCHGIMLANAAQGTIDAFLATDTEIEDVASAVVLAREAFLKITNEKGEPWTLQDRFILAANPLLHATISSCFGIPIL
ncbi:inositol monophosphatase family protein [bacterium]|nr:MAG: inositol monophosphatase family protein [bacterium]